jgi:hypothetical protein
VCVRVFLEKRDLHLQRFCEEFKKLTVADEKQDLVDSFLNKLHTEMENDPIWQGMSFLNNITIINYGLLSTFFHEIIIRYVFQATTLTNIKKSNY